ncbi:unnamed protein product [Symbiodinium sp. CCMP2592]|nr:unnamed protein product [Symbiodinium sp. CCMP2592]
MAFRLSASGPLKDGQPEARSGSLFGSAMGAFKDKASAAASAASAAAGAAVKSAKHGIEVAKDAMGPSGSSASSSFRPPPRGNEDIDLQRALEASMQPQAKAPSTGEEKRSLVESREDASAFPAEVEQLQSMGFAPDLAEVALMQSGGDLPAALALLCGEGSAQPRPSEEAEAKRTSLPRRMSTTSTASSVQAQALASYQSAKASLLSVKKRAEALFGQQKASLPSDYQGETFNIQVPNNIGAMPPGQSLQQRQASLQAAEKRLADARARNAGTMDDWRRYRQFRQQQEREEREQRAKQRASAAAAQSAKEEMVREDEEEDLQRALAASVSQIHHGEEASVAPTQSLDEEDPEVFELRLEQAMAEEELQLQQALVASLEAERAALEALDPTCSAAAVGEELEVQREQLAPGNYALKQIADAQIQESKEREKQLEESNQALQSRLEGLREALAQRGKDTQEEHEEAAVDDKSVHRSEEEIAESRPKSDGTKDEALTSSLDEKEENFEKDQKEKVESLEEDQKEEEAREAATPEEDQAEGAAAAEEKPKEPSESEGAKVASAP